MGWFKFKLLDKPYYDRKGNVLHSIVGRRNRYRKDEFYGGGKIYPDLEGHKILERYEHGNILLVKLDIPENEAVAIEGKSQALSAVATYRVRQGRRKRYTCPAKAMTYDFKDFQAKRITDAEAEALIKSWNMWAEPPESGVTK